MRGNTKEKFQLFICHLKTNRRYEVAMARGLQLYKIKQYNVQGLTPNRVSEMYSTLSNKFYLNQPPQSHESWHENELRVFIWVLIGYAFLHDKHISSFATPDWSFFGEVFNRASSDGFEFQSRAILKSKQKAKWSEEEKALLDSLIRSKSAKNKWNQIAKQFFVISDKRFFRTAKQCREHWINHLNPSTLRTSWTPQEDLHLIQSVSKHGKRWAMISKQLGGKRTEHMVKNRYKSLYNHEAKRTAGEQLSRDKQDKLILETLQQKLHEGTSEKQPPAEKVSPETLEVPVLPAKKDLFLNMILEHGELSEPPSVDVELQEIEDFGHEKLCEEAQKDYFNSFFQEAYNNIEGSIGLFK